MNVGLIASTTVLVAAAASAMAGCGEDIPEHAVLEPVKVLGLSDVRAISAGRDVTCAADAGGQAFCWGNNWSGSVGDGTSATSYSTPVKVSALSGVTSITVGDAHACATVDTGKAFCWGQGRGALGDDTTKNRLSPVEVVDLSGALSITAGSGHTCAATDDGSAWCWGASYWGAVGDGTLNASRLVPYQVLTLSDVIAIDGGDGYNCAVQGDGAAFCWGSNPTGALGDGTREDRATPALVKGISDVRSIAAGHRHTCAATGDGSAYCWGSNARGSLGVDEDDLDRALEPRKVEGISGVVSVAAGDEHTCAMTSDGGAWCWGYNGLGQLGDGSVDDRYEPARVEGLSGVVAITAGNFDSCAVLSDGTAWCWGNNSSGQLGAGEAPLSASD